MFTTRPVEVLGAALLALALLLPAGDPPWHSFWHEWTASVAVMLIVLGAVSRLRAEQRAIVLPAASLPALVIGLALAVGLQWVSGLVPYRGDALLVGAYLLAFALCIGVAQSLSSDDRAALADRLALALLVAALASVPLAVLQWLDVLTLDLGIPVAAGRPVGHLEQANLFCSLLIQGALGAWRLYERGRLGPRVAIVLLVPLLLTMILTQSRVAWLVMACVVVVFAWRRRSLAPRGRLAVIGAAAVVLVLGALLLPWLDAHLGLSGVPLADRASGGRRPTAWWLFLDAAWQRPWFGWGVLQTGAAQFEVAPRHPALLWLFSSAHDLPIDLLVWFGLPLGALASVALAVAGLRRLQRADDAPALVTALAAAALLLHALVEFPLHYAYFLLPLGLMLGVTQVDRPGPALRIPTGGSATLGALGLGPAVLLALLAQDYTRLSDVRPTMDFDKPSRHLVLSASLPLPDVWLLDQLQAFQAFAAVPMRSGLSAEVLAGLRTPMLRHTFVPSQERYAHLMALNGHAEEALDTLSRSCRMMTAPQCEEAHRAWSVWRAAGQPLPDWR